MAIMAAQRNAAIARQKSDSEKVLELLGEDTLVTYNGKGAYHLNSSLILKQGLDVSELRNLKALHAEKLKYFDLMRETDDREKLREYAHEVECIEFEMQKAWHFTQDRNFHEWYKVPKCTCPKMDNADNRGSNRRIIVMDCPVHGE
jgi:hydroxymethylpyrimidine pyrophosphatase-like HAD family hydrolase